MQNRTKELRKEKNLTLVELAKLLGVSDRSAGFFEAGERVPDTDTLDKLANFLMFQKKNNKLIKYIVGD